VRWPCEKMNGMINKALLILPVGILLLLPANLCAIEVKGKIVDGADLQPVKSARVKIAVESYEAELGGWLPLLENSTVTDRIGNYRFSNIPGGQRLALTVTIQAPGYVWCRYRQPLTGGRAERFDFGLARARGKIAILGVVRDVESDGPLSGAKFIVKLKEKRKGGGGVVTKQVIKAVTDDAGRCSLAIPARFSSFCYPGDRCFSVDVIKPGYETATIRGMSRALYGEGRAAAGVNFSKYECDVYLLFGAGKESPEQASPPLSALPKTPPAAEAPVETSSGDAGRPPRVEDVATVREKESMISFEDLEKVNINTATVEELMTLPRVGSRTALSIIQFRETHGYFRKPEEIVRVRGIGPMAYDFYLKERITVGGEVAALPEKTLPAARPAIERKAPVVRAPPTAPARVTPVERERSAGRKALPEKAPVPALKKLGEYKKRFSAFLRGGRKIHYAVLFVFAGIIALFLIAYFTQARKARR